MGAGTAGSAGEEGEDGAEQLPLPGQTITLDELASSFNYARNIGDSADSLADFESSESAVLLRSAASVLAVRRHWGVPRILGAIKEAAARSQVRGRAGLCG
jgi:hypothetical protein